MPDHQTICPDNDRFAEEDLGGPGGTDPGPEKLGLDGAAERACERSPTQQAFEHGPTQQAFEDGVDRLRRARADELGRHHLWHAHHWPHDYPQRCVRIGSRHWCRRCLCLYPLGFLVAVLSAAGMPPWPPSADPAMIWLLCIPGTVAFVGEAVGAFSYRPRWQVGATLVTAVAFGRGLGYELVDRWSAQFWQPVAVFGGIWFLASVLQHRTAR